MTEPIRLPASILSRNAWDYGIVEVANSYTGNSAMDLSASLPSNQTWLKQSDIDSVRTWVHGHWPSHYLRHTTSSNVAKMGVFNDLADVGWFNVKYDVPRAWSYDPISHQWRASMEHGTEYAVYSKVWRERTGATYDYFNCVAAGRALPVPLTDNWWISLYRQDVYTIADRVGIYFFYMSHYFDWWDRLTPAYNRQRFWDSDLGEFVEVEEIPPDPWIDPYADRIPTTVTAEDGTRTFVRHNGGQETLPANASEPRTLYIARIIAYT